MDSDSLSYGKKITKVKKNKKILQPSLLHHIRSILFELFNQVRMNSPSFYLLSLLLKTYLLFSIITFSNLPQSSVLFPKNTLTNSIIDAFSSCFLLAYSEANNVHLLLLAYIFIAVFVFVAIFISISALILHKTSKVPTPIVYILDLIILFSPIIIHFLILSLSHLLRVIFLYQTDQFPHILSVIIVLLVIFAIYFPFYYAFLSPSIYFRPSMILFYSSQIEKYFYLLIHCFTFFSVTFSHGYELSSVILAYFGLIFLFLIILFYFFDYGIISTSQYYTELPVFILSFFLLFSVNSTRLVNYLQTDSKISMPSYFIFIFMMFYILLMAIIAVIMQQLKEKYLRKLDQIEEFEIESERQFFRLLRFGMENNHPRFVDWTLFRQIQSNEQYTKQFMTCYVKFLSYYYGKEGELKYAIQIFSTKWKEEVVMKNLTYQILSLLQSRERSLSLNLQKKINSLNNKCVKCRSLMRYIWENVIRNDLSNIDRLSFQLHSRIHKIQKEYHYMMLSYKHNHYLLKSYSYFLTGIVHKFNEGQYYNRIQKKLRSGELVNKENAQIVSKELMHMCLQEPDYYIKPTVDLVSIDSMYQKIENYSKGINSEEKTDEINSNELIKEDGIDENDNYFKDKKLHTKLESIIDDVQLPSMKVIVPLIFFVFCILIPVLILIPFLVSYEHASVDRTAFLSIIQSGGLAPSFIQMLVTAVYCAINANGYMVPIVKNFESLNISTEYWPFGWTNETTNDDIFIEILDNFRSRISGFNALISEVSLQKYYFNSIVAPFYANDYDFRLYGVEPDPEIYIPKITTLIKNCSLSMESILALYMTISYRILSFEETWRWFYSFEQDFRNIELNSDSILSNLEQYTATIMELAIEDRKRHSSIMTIVLLFISILIIIISTVTWVIVSCLFNRDSTKVYFILQFVPKSEISAVMHDLLPKDDDEMVDDKRQGIRNQALKTLITPVKRFKKDWFSIVRIILTLLLFCIVFLNLGVQIYLKDHLVDRPFNSAPMIYHCGRMHTIVGTIIHKMLIVSIFWITSDINVTVLKEEIIQTTFEALPALDEFRFGREGGANYHGINTVDSIFANQFSQQLCNLSIDKMTRTNLFMCQNFETSLSWILTAVRKAMDYEPGVDYDDTTFNIFFLWLYRNSYEMFVLPTEEYLMRMFEDYVLSFKKTTLMSTLIFIAALFLIGLIFTGLSSKIADSVYDCLRLLLFVDPHIVFQSKPITKLLLNDFSTFMHQKSSTSISKSDKYFNFIAYLNDAVIITTNDGKIAAINKAAIRLLTDPNKVKYFQDNYAKNDVESESVEKPTFFNLIPKTTLDQKHIDSNELDTYLKNITDDSKNTESSINLDDYEYLIGSNIVDVINNNKFANIFNVSQNQRIIPQFDLPLNSDDSIHMKSLAFLHTGEIANSIDVSSNCVAFYCFIILDKIQIASLNRILDVESMKCNELIATFFPTPLVSIIKEGQTNHVHLTIPSATILFVTLPNLEVIAGDHETGLKVLAMFADEANKLLESHPSLTLIKMYGSSLMLVGGIFNSNDFTDAAHTLERTLTPQRSINGPISHQMNSDESDSIDHSVDTVSYAIDLIHAVGRLSKEMNLELNCTAGINICSSVTVGLVGEKRPSIEVIGNGVYHAQIMNETAQPKTIHITEALYNTIFSAGFVIREDKDVEIGEKKMKTFCIVDYAEN